MKAEEAYALSRKYTENTVAGAGAVAGKPCQIQSITDITGGHRVTFLWKDNSNVDHTSIMDVMDGKGIKAVAVNSSNHLIITYDDDTIVDAGEIDIHSAVNSVNGKTGNVNLTASDVGALPNNTSIPSKTSDLTNDSIVDSASYDSANHQILFKNGTTILFSLDAAAFVKDGMVDDVEISGGNLVITFNTDAGKQAISIPLTDIFDPANYYDKDDVDGLLVDKADKTDVDSVIAEQQSLLKDTVGWTGKNLIPLPYEFGTSQTQGGITAKVNTDGSITFNGTVTSSVSFRLKGRSVNDNNYFLVKPGRYIFSCNNIENNFYWGIATTKNNSYVAILDGIHESTIGLTITSDMSDEAVDGAIPLAIYANFRTLGDVYNNFTVYPMIRHADITDPTYEPYHESVEQTLRDAEVIEGKNRLENKATSTGIFTVNSDKSITANGTYTGGANALKIADIYDTDFSGYMFNGCPSGGGYSNAYRLFYRVTKKSDGTLVNDKSAYDTGSGVALTHSIDTSTEYIQVWLQVDNNVTLNNKTFYPMISKEGGAYEPFYIPLKESKVDWTSQGVLGAKNLLETTASTTTVNGVTFTVNSDGSVTVNGTATADAYLRIGSILDKVDSSKKYILSGCPSNGSSSSYFQYVSYQPGNGDLGTDIGDGITFQPSVSGVTFTSLAIYIYIRSGQTLNSLTFKPMLRLASDPDDTYQPYAMTNRELTEKRFEKRILSSGDDLNNITKTGIYHVATSVSNVPENRANLTLIVSGFVSNQIRQVLMTKEAMYTRSKEGATWSSWYKFTGTVVS